jgi:hypothetical protein
VHQVRTVNVAGTESLHDHVETKQGQLSTGAMAAISPGLQTGVMAALCNQRPTPPGQAQGQDHGYLPAVGSWRRVGTIRRRGVHRCWVREPGGARALSGGVRRSISRQGLGFRRI